MYVDRHGFYLDTIYLVGWFIKCFEDFGYIIDCTGK